MVLSRSGLVNFAAHNTERSQTRSWDATGRAEACKLVKEFALLASHGCRSRSAPKDAAEVQQL